jgi:hypothetical protein
LYKPDLHIVSISRDGIPISPQNDSSQEPTCSATVSSSFGVSAGPTFAIFSTVSYNQRA